MSLLWNLTRMEPMCNWSNLFVEGAWNPLRQYHVWWSQKTYYRSTDKIKKLMVAQKLHVYYHYFFIYSSFIHRNKVSCFRHCLFYHHRLFISSPVCLVTGAYEGLQTTASPNPVFAIFTTLPSHKQMPSHDIRWKLQSIFLFTVGQSNDNVQNLK